MDFPDVSRDLLSVEKNWKDLGRAVGYARKARGWTQRGLARAIIQKTTGAVSDRTLGTLERGEPVADTTLQRVAVALDWEPSLPEEILSGVVAVGLAGELLPPGTAQFSGTGSLTTAVSPQGLTRPGRTVYGVSEPLPDHTLWDARQAVADHERDFSVALGQLEDLLVTLNRAIGSGTEDLGDPLHLVDRALEELDKIVAYDQGRRFWQRQVELFRRDIDSSGAAARRGRKSQVTDPEPHAE